jgi:hypothetical protein
MAVATGHVTAQTTLKNGVFATGGGMMSGSTFAAAGTIGQSVIGRSTGTTFASSAGFWGDGGVILAIEGDVAPAIPQVFALLQNYPNPFNPSTMIKFELPKASQVNLTVHDLLGRQVAVLANGPRNAGTQEVKFDASGLSSGVYFYRLEAGDFVSIKRLLFLK